MNSANYFGDRNYSGRKLDYLQSMWRYQTLVCASTSVYGLDNKLIYTKKYYGLVNG